MLSFQTPGLVPNRPHVHRRVQSTVPMSPGASASFGTLQNQFAGLGLGQPSQDMPRGHGRRHSVNVVNKSSNGHYSVSYGAQDGYDDGFVPPAALGGHSRQVSRVDSTWRISKFL